MFQILRSVLWREAHPAVGRSLVSQPISWMQCGRVQGAPCADDRGALGSHAGVWGRCRLRSSSELAPDSIWGSVVEGSSLFVENFSSGEPALGVRTPALRKGAQHQGMGSRAWRAWGGVCLLRGGPSGHPRSQRPSLTLGWAQVPEGPPRRSPVPTPWDGTGSLGMEAAWSPDSLAQEMGCLSEDAGQILLSGALWPLAWCL